MTAARVRTTLGYLAYQYETPYTIVLALTAYDNQWRVGANNKITCATDGTAQSLGSSSLIRYTLFTQTDRQITAPRTGVVQISAQHSACRAQVEPVWRYGRMFNFEPKRPGFQPRSGQQLFPSR